MDLITAREFHDFISARRFNEGLPPVSESEEEQKEPLTFSQQKAARILQNRLNAKLKETPTPVQASVTFEDSIES